jgi:hypothetical protein
MARLDRNSQIIIAQVYNIDFIYTSRTKKFIMVLVLETLESVVFYTYIFQIYFKCKIICMKHHMLKSTWILLNER